MDTIKSFKGYGKVDPLEEQAFKRKTRKRLIIVAVSLVVLAVLIVGVVVGTLVHKNNKGGSGGADATPSPIPTSPAQSLKAICSVTNYPGSCYASISELKTSNTSDPEKLFRLSLQVALNALQKVSTLLPEKWSNSTKDPGVKKALGVCQTVFDDAIDMLNDSISAMNAKDGERLLTVTKINDLKTWLSTTLTDQDTCLDALEEVNATIIEDVKDLMNNSTEFASNSLAIVSKILGILGDFKIPVHRRLLGTVGGSGSKFPEWVRAADRKLLQQNSNPKPNVVVAKDGSGDVTTIREAIAKVPKKSATRFIIYAKAGEYLEQLILDKSFWNLMIYGDGKGKTIISFDDNFIDGTRTFDTATFAIAGRNFIAKDITFKNTAGASKHQAVAVRSGSDRSVFYRCSFDGFQDTLYAHSNRQFYRECDISGTIDFIFGNAAVVFQNCNIQPRQPMPNQFVTITAQGKKDPNQNTGISIQNCAMSPLDNLTAPTYLGRPWKNFSTTVIMNSQIGGFLAPKGWIEWTPNVEPPNTIFYAEYQNTGPGASVDQRIKWAGYKPTISPNQASQYTVQSFIQGDVWLPETQVTFT